MDLRRERPLPSKSSPSRVRSEAASDSELHLHAQRSYQRIVRRETGIDDVLQIWLHREPRGELKLVERFHRRLGFVRETGAVAEVHPSGAEARHVGIALRNKTRIRQPAADVVVDRNGAFLGVVVDEKRAKAL